MKPLLFLLVVSSAMLSMDQAPTITSWIINPGEETGYNGMLTNVQQVAYTEADVYVRCTCVPGYDIGPWVGNPNTPTNQDFCFRITREPMENTGTLVNTPLGHIGVWRNGVSIFNAKDGMSYNNQGIWNRDAYIFEGPSFDACLGHPAPNGEYHHHVSPNCLYAHTDDEHHSDLIGFAFDGYPVYGAFAYTNPDGTGGLSRMRSSYQLRGITERTTRPDGSALQVNQYGPAIGGQYPLGAFLEDYAFVSGSGDLDEHNGRTCVTPEYPEGTYAYFVTLTESLLPAYPYVIGPTYRGTVSAGNTGPQSGHFTIPGNATTYPNHTGVVAADPAFTGMKVFPIPTDGPLTIANIPSQGVILDLLDATGRTVMQRSLTGSQVELDLLPLPAGSYLIQMRGVDGHVLQARAVVR